MEQRSAERAGTVFRGHDEATMQRLHGVRADNARYLTLAAAARADLESLMTDERAVDAERSEQGALGS